MPISSVWSRVKLRLKRLNTKPLVSRDYDIRLLKHVSRRRIPTMRQMLSIHRILSVQEKIVLMASLIVFGVGLIWGGTVITGNYRTEVPAVGGKYTEAVVGAPHLINPLFAPLNDVDQDLVHLIYSGLMRYDSEQRLVPDLAASYEVSEDKKIYTFTLKQDVVWHDNSPFTAHDVVFTFQLAQDPMIVSPLAAAFQGVRVEAIDEYTVRFTLPEAFPSFLSSLTTGILPQHIWAEIPVDQIKLAQRNIQPIGTGPFKYTQIVKDGTGYIHRYEMERFDRYYRKPPFIQEFVFEFFSDYDVGNGALQAFKEQKVDGLNFVPLSLRSKVERKHVNLPTLQLPQYTALFFNQHRENGLSNEDMRSALSQALDKDRIVRDTLSGEARVVHSPVLPGFPGFDAEIGVVAYQVDKANELLDKTWKRTEASAYREELKQKYIEEWRTSQPTPTSTSAEGENEENMATSTEITPEVLQGIEDRLNQELNSAQLFYRKDTEGNVLALNLVTVNTTEYEKVAQLIAGYWQDIGVKTNIQLVSAKDMTRVVLKDRAYDVLLYGVVVGGDPDQYPFWHSSQVEYPGLNLAGYVNRSVDETLMKIRTTSDEAELSELYKSLQTKISEDIPAIFLYTPTYTYALMDRIQGFKVSRIAHPSDRFANVIDWYIKTKGVWRF